MKKYKNFIFDLDGTLIDSTPSHIEAFHIAINSTSRANVSSFNYEVMKGKRTIDVMKELGFSEEESLRLTKIKQDSYRELLNSGKVELFPGVIDCFQHLRENDCSSFICTGASRPSVEIILDKFNLRKYVTDYITGSDVVEAKPNPKILNNLIEDNKIEKRDCIFIEDSVNGKECGVNAGVDTIIVNNVELKGENDFNSLLDFHQALKEVF